MEETFDAEYEVDIELRGAKYEVACPLCPQKFRTYFESAAPQVLEEHMNYWHAYDSADARIGHA